MFNELVDMISKTNKRVDDVAATVDSFDTILKDISATKPVASGADPVFLKKVSDVEASISSLSQSFKILTDEVRNVKARLEQDKTVLETSIYSKLEKLLLEKLPSPTETKPVESA